MAEVDIVQSFNSGIEPGLHSDYTQVNVLLIHWAKNDLDGVEKEIQDLQSVFEADYNYNTFLFRIPDNGSHCQRLNTEISSFVENKSQRGTLIIVYYAGHCSPDELGQAEWAALEEGGPSLSWNAGQQILFSAPGDVLLILDCCYASLITPGLKNQGTRFELIAASARSARTPMPGPKSLTRILTKLLKEHADEGISSENLSSKLREHNKITETPVFHNFVRKSPTSIQLQRLAHDKGFIPKPSGYLLLRVSLTGEVTGAQMAQWLKSAPPNHVATVNIEAVVRRGSQVQEAFPKGSVFETMPSPVQEEITRRILGLDTVITVLGQPFGASVAVSGKAKTGQALTSTACIEIKPPLPGGNGRDSNSTYDIPEGTGTPSLLAATETDLLLVFRQALVNESLCVHSTEISFNAIAFGKGKKQRGSRGKQHRQRFKYGTIADQPVLVEIYKDREAGADSGELHPKRLHQARQVTGLLCHPKQARFPVLPCAGFVRNHSRKELGLVFKLPPNLEVDGDGGVTTLFELYRMHKLVSLGHRIHLALALTTAVERFHSVGWVHKSIRSNNVAFTATSTIPSALELQDEEYENTVSPCLGSFDLSGPLLFGFEYSRAGDTAAYLEEDHSLYNNLYRIPEQWGKPTARFEKSHDVYSLGVILLEIALWKDVGSVLKSYLDKGRVIPSEVAQLLMEKCVKVLPHQVGEVFARCILTCLDFGSKTRGLSKYETQRYFQKNIVEPMGRVVQRV